MLLEPWARNWVRSASCAFVPPPVSKSASKWLARVRAAHKIFFSAALQVIRGVKGQRT